MPFPAVPAWLREYDLNARTVGAIVASGIPSAEAIKTKTWEWWSTIPGCGYKTLVVIDKVFGPLPRSTQRTYYVRRVEKKYPQEPRA